VAGSEYGRGDGLGQAYRHTELITSHTHRRTSLKHTRTTDVRPYMGLRWSWWLWNGGGVSVWIPGYLLRGKAKNVQGQD